jgi:hypothetical protein
MLLAWMALSVAWSWPLAADPVASTVSLHFDQLPAAWLVDAARSFLPSGVSSWSAWPSGEPMQRLDSFLFVGLAMAFGGAVPGMLLTNLFVLLGPVASAWAMACAARRMLGVDRAGQFFAGVLYGFGPMALVAALEGQVYALLAPWLPLCAWAAWEGRAVATAMAFALALCGTAYHGVNAALVLAAVLWLRLPVLGRGAVARVLGAVGVAGAAYAAFYATGASRGTGPVEGATPVTLLAWSPWLDLARHSLGPVLGVATLAFAVGAVLRWREIGLDRRLARGLFVLGACAVLLALGPRLQLGVVPGRGVPTPLALLEGTGVFRALRFPLRFGLTAALAWSMLGAALVSRMRRPWVAVLAALLDVLVAGGAVGRLRGHPVPVPRLYALLPQAPVLELYPEFGDSREDLNYYAQNLACHYQRFHRRPILERCLNTDLSTSPRWQAGAALHARVFAGEPVLAWLKAQRVGSVVVHADLYAPDMREEVLGALLRELGEPVAQGHDGGEWLMAWKVPT